MADPNGHPYEIVREALVSGLRRSEAVEGAGVIRPWLQDFTLGSPRYEAPEVRAQIQATYDAGIDEWLLWNASSRYTEAALEPAEVLSRRFRAEHARRRKDRTRVRTVRRDGGGSRGTDVGPGRGG